MPPGAEAGKIAVPRQWSRGHCGVTPQPAEEAPYLVKVHQVWAGKAGGLRKDSLLAVHLGAWGPPARPSCGRLKEDSRYIFFMEPDANGSSRAPAAFRASFPPLETGRNLKKEVSRVLCKRRESADGTYGQGLLVSADSQTSALKSLYRCGRLCGEVMSD
ncbi:Pro-neuregulin-2, membrane-bound isoform [Fukomys damarensis]|uniref:Pro-neuregulin-2, membrane-bound isoform n=1 Tax=Fukomys damarensis TaxID=885580 RepID=A0A091E399_FUKDA|nr:Pro-neuregulin-2, membrane-bound isoform [Fukomys damarensis]